jgi:hypothetical protein
MRPRYDAKPQQNFTPKKDQQETIAPVKNRVVTTKSGRGAREVDGGRERKGDR